MFSFAADECYSDVVQQARSVVESGEVLEEVISQTTTGGLPPVETNATLTVSNHNKQHFTFCTTTFQNNK